MTEANLTIEERKRQLRAYFSGVRTGLSPLERAEKNRKIVDHLCNWVTANDIIRSRSVSHEMEQTPVIALYSAFRDEADLSEGLSKLKSLGCQVVYPRVIKQQKQMTFHIVNQLTDLEVGSYGILEPNVERSPVVLAEDIDVIVVPGLSFTRTGLRLGYGGGFYDRMFSRLSVRALRVGVGFALQVAEELPAAEHDVRMHYLLTEEGFEACGVSY